MHRLLSMAISPNSQRAYATGLNSFCRFLQCRSVPLAPASVEHVRQFVAWLSLQHLAPATVASYVAGVGYFHKLNGWSDPTKDFVVSKLVEGCRRDCPSVDNRLPISIAVLEGICQALPQVCNSQFECTLFRAAVLSAFFGFMRIGEFAANSRHKVQRSILAISDLQFCTSGSQNSVLLSFRHSKANQTGIPQTICLVPSQNVSICPVRALQQFVGVRPMVSGALFCHFDTSPLTKYQFNAVLRKVMTFCGWQELHFTSHSFRIGAATTAFELGVSQTDIQRMGRWRSDSVFSYIRSVQPSFMPGV